MKYSPRKNWFESFFICKVPLLIQDFKKSLEIQSTILLGYSLGANYTLGLVCADPASVQELWLVAGDGLSFRPLFRFVTGTVIGRYLFKGFVRFPGWVRFVLNLGSVTRILPERTARFFLSTIDSQPKRALLMQRWISAGRISPSPSTIIQTLNNHSIHCRMVYGEHDSLIPVRFARKFARKLNHVDLQLVPEGHMLLKSRYFKSFLTQPSLPWFLNLFNSHLTYWKLLRLDWARDWLFISFSNPFGWKSRGMQT